MKWNELKKQAVKHGFQFVKHGTFIAYNTDASPYTLIGRGGSCRVAPFHFISFYPDKVCTLSGFFLLCYFVVPPSARFRRSTIARSCCTVFAPLLDKSMCKGFPQ